MSLSDLVLVDVHFILKARGLGDARVIAAETLGGSRNVRNQGAR